MIVVVPQAITYENCSFWLCGKEIAIEHDGISELIRGGFRCDGCGKVVHADCASGKANCDECQPPKCEDAMPSDLSLCAAEVHHALKRFCEKLEGETDHLVISAARADVAEWQCKLNHIVNVYRSQLAAAYRRLEA